MRRDKVRLSCPGTHSTACCLTVAAVLLLSLIPGCTMCPTTCRTPAIKGGSLPRQALLRTQALYEDRFAQGQMKTHLLRGAWVRFPPSAALVLDHSLMVLFSGLCGSKSLERHLPLTVRLCLGTVFCTHPALPCHLGMASAVPWFLSLPFWMILACQ